MADGDVPQNPDDPQDPFGFGSGSGNPFGGFGMLGDLGKLLGGAGDGGWAAARQLAVAMANDGQPEDNVDPSVRIELEGLCRVAELHASNALGLSAVGGPVSILPVTRAQYADTTLAAYKPLFQAMSASLGTNAAGGSSSDVGDDPAAALFGQMMQMLAPMMLGMTAGSMVGHLSHGGLGQYDIPVPRQGNELHVVPANLDAFGDEWSLPRQDLRLWICIHEIMHHLILSVPHVAATLDAMFREFAGGFQVDPTALENQLGNLDISNPAALAELQQTLGDPSAILGAIQSPAQLALLPRLRALTAVIVGIVDHKMDQVGPGLLGSYDQLTEALRRRRVEADPSDRFIEQMLGLELTQEQYERGAAFATGVISRGGEDALARLWENATMLPTPNEVDAPGLWLARIDLPA